MWLLTRLCVWLTFDFTELLFFWQWLDCVSLFTLVLILLRLHFQSGLLYNIQAASLLWSLLSPAAFHLHLYVCAVFWVFFHVSFGFVCMTAAVQEKKCLHTFSWWLHAGMSNPRSRHQLHSTHHRCKCKLPFSLWVCFAVVWTKHQLCLMHLCRMES